MGSGNQSLYCEFVDAFCRVNSPSRAVAVSDAQNEWRKVRSNPADVRRRIDELDAMAKKAKWHLLVPLLHAEIVEEAQEKPFCRARDITGPT